MKDYFRAISSLRKGSSFTALSEKYEDILWQDENKTIPTKKECEDELKRLEEEDKKTQYQRDRAADYPSWQEQMDLLYHGGVDALKAELKKTKDKFPKPS